MTAVSLLCDLCDNAITGDSHWPHDPDCIERDGCTCAVVCCLGCCPDCAPSSEPRPPGSDTEAGILPASVHPAGGQHGTATVEARQVGTQPAPPVGRNRNATNNGTSAHRAGRGVSSSVSESASTPRGATEASEAGAAHSPHGSASPGDWPVSKTGCGGSTPPRPAQTNEEATAPLSRPVA